MLLVSVKPEIEYTVHRANNASLPPNPDVSRVLTEILSQLPTIEGTVMIIFGTTGLKGAAIETAVLGAKLYSWHTSWEIDEAQAALIFFGRRKTLSWIRGSVLFVPIGRIAQTLVLFKK